MNVKILASLLTLGLASAGLGYGTFAYFTDEETSTGNIFTAATLDLKTNDADGVTGTIAASSFAPGDTATGSLTLKNDGTLATGLDLDFKAVMSVTDDAAANAGGTCSAAEQMDKFITITTLTYDGTTDLLALITDADADGRISLDDLEAHGVFADLANPGAGKVLQMDVLFDTAAPNCNQADSVDMTWTFQLAQTAAADLV